MTDVLIPHAPAEVRKQGSLLGEKTYAPVFELNQDGTPKVEVIAGKGIFRYFQNAPHPMKGWPTPEAVYALGHLKTSLLELAKLAKNPLVLLGLLTTKNLVGRYNHLHERIFRYNNQSLNLQEEYLCESARNVAKFAHSVLVSLNVEETTAKQFALNVAQFIEYDDAYRYRIQDLMTEMDNEKIRENPVKEIKRLIQLLKERSGIKIGVALKIESLLAPILLLLYIPKYRKLFIRNVHYLKMMKFDDADWYWVSLRADYEYGGIPYLERMKDLPQPMWIELQA